MAKIGLRWLVIVGLASLVWFTVQDRPKGDRLNSVIAAVAGIAGVSIIRWIVRKVEPPGDSGENGSAFSNQK
jgi:hypothetical protein